MLLNGGHILVMFNYGWMEERAGESWVATISPGPNLAARPALYTHRITRLPHSPYAEGLGVRYSNVESSIKLKLEL